MKLFFCALVLAFAACSAKPTKRFAGFNVAGIGGSAGCVVTGNKLFANGFFLRELTAAEQNELAQYENNVKKYKEDVKAALEERRKQWQKARGGKTLKTTSSEKTETLPVAPEKPSFCSAADTTQYYFDGCMVQNNKVYVGREYARDLTPEEISELKEFDAKMSKYQDYLKGSIQQQMQGLFGGRDFWQGLLGEEPKQSTESPVSTTTLTPVETPTAPNFCTAIY